MDDRTVHARTANGTLIVRYDRAGKWYAEKPDGYRWCINIGEAVSLATEVGSYVYFGKPGGTIFEARVRTRAAAMAEHREPVS